MKNLKPKVKEKVKKSDKPNPGDGASAPVFPSEFESILESSMKTESENEKSNLSQPEADTTNPVVKNNIKAKSSAWALNNYHTSKKHNGSSGGHMNEMLKSAGKIEDTLRLLKNM